MSNGEKSWGQRDLPWASAGGASRGSRTTAGHMLPLWVLFFCSLSCRKWVGTEQEMKMIQCVRSMDCFFSGVAAVGIRWWHHTDGQEMELGMVVASHHCPMSGWHVQKLAWWHLPMHTAHYWHHQATETKNICAGTWQLVTEACTGEGLIKQACYLGRQG